MAVAEVGDVDGIDAARITWDGIAHLFSVNRDNSYVPAMENYESLWPSLNQALRDCAHVFHPGYAKEPRICDYGCGTGVIAESLCHSFEVYGYDISSEMIRIARENGKGKVTYGVGGIEAMRSGSPYVAIFSTMVFQFIEDLNPVLEAMRESLRLGGLLFMAVHNLGYAAKCMENDVKFRRTQSLDPTDKSGDSPFVGEVEIGGTWVRTYLREPDWYDRLLSHVGFAKIGCSFTCAKPPRGLEALADGWSANKYYSAWYRKMG